MSTAASYLPRPLPLFLLLLYAAFCVPMAGIVLQYVPAGTDTAFLGVKQQCVALPGYLPAFYIHVFIAILALPAGFTQFFDVLRRRHPALHRWQGRAYAYAILAAGAPSGFAIGLVANGGPGSRLAFCLLAVLWWYSTFRAVQEARRGHFDAHADWMYRSFALTLSALTLRAWKWAIVTVLHPHPMDVYRVVAWLGWTLNLLVAEYLIYKKRSL